MKNPCELNPLTCAADPEPVCARARVRSPDRWALCRGEACPVLGPSVAGAVHEADDLERGHCKEREKQERGENDKRPMEKMKTVAAAEATTLATAATAAAAATTLATATKEKQQ